MGAGSFSKNSFSTLKAPLKDVSSVELFRTLGKDLWSVFAFVMLQSQPSPVQFVSIKTKH